MSIVHVDLSPGTEREGEAITWLDEQELGRLRRFEHGGPRRRYSLCRAALRAVLCEALNCRNEQLSFRTSRYGKPYALVQGELTSMSFNVSHSGNHGLVAYGSTGRLGVDIEERDTQRDLSLLIDTVLCTEEKTALALSQGQARMRLFFKLWTLKEAVLKALGMGFSMDATRIRIPPAMLCGKENGILRLPWLPAVTFHVEDLGKASFAAAVAIELEPDPAKRD